jgi:hypothetical protein
MPHCERRFPPSDFEEGTMFGRLVLLGVGFLWAVIIAQLVQPTDGRAALHCQSHEVTLAGTAGPDILQGTPGRDVILAKGGADVCTEGPVTT